MVKHTQHEKAKRIIVPGSISATIGLSNAEEGSGDDSKAEIEQSESTKNGVGISVAQNKLPLCRDYHANACHSKEVADEGGGDGQAPPTHQSKR
jgi:hypothetical protein